MIPRNPAARRALTIRRLPAFAATTAVLSLAQVACSSPESGAPFSYGTQSTSALAAYERGWTQIMAEGRWTAAEASFRTAAELDPEWVMGAALVARITHDVDERESLLGFIEDSLDRVDPDTRLILDVFILNIRAANARDREAPLPDGFNEERQRLAVANFGAFVEAHPQETWKQAEHAEWLHAAEGAEVGLDYIRTGLPPGMRESPFFLYYSALLEAQLGDHERAADLARSYEVALEDPMAPGVFALRANLAASRGDYAEALRFAERAAELDPKHVIVVGLRDRLRAQVE